MSQDIDNKNGETVINARALAKDILVGIYDDGEKITRLGGKPFWMPYDDSFGPDAMKRDAHNSHPGIRPRFGVVLSTSPYAEKLGVNVRDKVLLDTMKWSRGFPLGIGMKCWRIKVDDILLVDNGGFDADETDRINEKFPGVLV